MEQILWVESFNNEATFVNKICINTKFEFRTTKSETENKTSNDVIKSWYNDSGDQQNRAAAYGWIKAIFEHKMYPGGPKMLLYDCEWAEVLKDVSSTGLTVVRRGGVNNFNMNCRFEKVANCMPYNLALLPMNLTDPGCDEFAVIDPSRKLGLY